MGKKLSNDELGRLSVQEFKEASKIPVLIVLDDVRSLNNVGSVFRTADAFRVEKIFLCGITGTPPHKDIHKTALGATDSVDWEYRKDILKLIDELKEYNYQIISVEQTVDSLSLESFEPGEEVKTVLIFGNEVKGVHQEVIDRSDMSLEIPQMGTKHSFNISVSAGIVLWEVFRKLML